MHLVFKDFGIVLGGRDLAGQIRQKIDAFDGAVTLDFQSVDTVSHSFADELIGKLAFSYGAEKFKEKIKIINLSEANRNIFGYVIADRFSEQESHA